MKKKTPILILFCLVCAMLLCSCGDTAGARDGDLAFSMNYKGEEGSISSDSAYGYYAPGTEITAHATPAEGYAFFCWTENDTLAKGGTVVSYEKDYTFPLEADTTLYANFREHSSVLVRYHANGGVALKTSDSTEEAIQAAARETEPNECYWDDFSLDYFLYPNGPADMGYFERDGYLLVGYNTEPDESGEFFNLGGKIFEDTDHVIELWCVWRETTPETEFVFTYNDTYAGWAISDYVGPGGDIFIPETYNGEPVVGVNSGAFALNEDVTGIAFPKTMKYIADYSCNDMPNLLSLLLFDSLDYVCDASFENDTELTLVIFSAATPPHYTNWFNNHAKKVELMYYYRDSERPKMIILGGSSTSYSVDAQQLEAALDRDYLVLNCGSNGANLFSMTSAWALRFMNEGDFLLQIVEYSYWQMGGLQCTWETFRSFESCYNVYTWIPAGNFVKFFDSFNDYLYHRKGEAETDYEAYVSNLAGTTGYYDMQGTLTVVTKPNGRSDFTNNRRFEFHDDYLYDFMVNTSNFMYDMMDEQGVEHAIAFTPLNRNSVVYYQTDENIEAFEQYLKDNLNSPVISDLQENIMDPEVFFDDDYHLAAPAREIYTDRLARDLNAYFASAD